MKMFQLHIGSDSQTKQIPAATEKRICQMVGKVFESFTVLRGYGFFCGTAEEVLIVKIATTDETAIWSLAHRLRKGLQQAGIGIEFNGIYERATAPIAKKNCRARKPRR